MPNHCHPDLLEFHPLALGDKEPLQRVTLSSGLRNCNFNFTNLIGWQFWFNTEICIYENTALFRFNLDGRRAYMVCSSKPPSAHLLQLLCNDASFVDTDLLILCMENGMAEAIKAMMPDRATIQPKRDQYDYIYLRQELAEVKGKSLKAKRNHINKFLSEHPNFYYRELDPSLFSECRRLGRLWRSEKYQDNHRSNITANAEMRAMETVFSHWNSLGTRGGCIYVDTQMVAFSYGAAVTHDTFDVCVEKADRNIAGAFNIINQQFAAHLPEQYVYVNREEDMGLEGLRKSKLSYHPHVLLTYNNVLIRCH